MESIVIVAAGIARFDMRVV